jgi:hypothetical protein
LSLGLTELATRGIFPSALSGLGGDVFAVILILVSLGLMFWGRSVIKALAFLVAGLAGAGLGVAAGGIVLGPIGSLVGALVGFVVGGLFGLLLVHLGIGIALGYFGYLATRDLTHSLVLAFAAGVILFFAGLAASSRLLELATAAVGGFMLYSALVYFGASDILATVVAAILAIAGFVVQQRGRQMGEHWRRGV